ncbi:helix-turn-helix domain-containing protein [Phytopseudomonas dryadis]|uniref:HTH cro/C1-type domain-containing protein n=1 Tax=Phytopseudomonas dryadis TaxID=2487520 RepID=A0ABY1Z2E9_9GAMM|nr:MULTISPECIES: helix-turn-helix transcriptional regulator [Pseudomonas]TBV01229.1 hypothetical protein DNK34_21575 [Pseudomonas dryadis]TBV14733.1 hypothetical protein DNK41_19485 [Pseudomonas sp. FRB 230]
MTDSFGEKLSRRRNELGLTLRELGDIIGISGSQISRYEAGQAKPRRKVLVRLAEALGMDPADLVEKYLVEPFSQDAIARFNQAAYEKQELRELEESDLEDYDPRQTKLVIRVEGSNGHSMGYQVEPCMPLEGGFTSPDHLQQVILDRLAPELEKLLPELRKIQLTEITLRFQEPLSKKAKIKRIMQNRRLMGQ